MSSLDLPYKFCEKQKVFSILLEVVNKGCKASLKTVLQVAL